MVGVRIIARLRPSVAAGVAAFLLTAAALIAAILLVPDGAHFLRAKWVIHPDEQGYLLLARHLARDGSLIINDDWYTQSRGHLPEGVTLRNGSLAPRKAIGGYVVYAVPFLISDDAWLYVARFFGVLTAVAAGLIVHSRTRSRAAAVLAGVAVATASPFIMWGSGLAFSDVIATALFLLGVYVLAQYVRTHNATSASLAGILFGVATLMRYDFAVAGLLAFASLLVVPGRWRTPLSKVALGAGWFGLFLGLAALANWVFYGDVQTTGYGPASWQGSASGVSDSLIDFSAGDFANLAPSYMVAIGLSCTVLFAFGIVMKVATRTFHFTDIALGAFSVFLVLYFLGREGAYGTGYTWLVSSYPRYLLPFYATGAILGAEGLFLLLRGMTHYQLLRGSVFLAVALVVAALGLREAYLNEKGVPYAERLTGQHRMVEELARRFPDSVIVSDLEGRAVISARTLVPRRLPTEEDLEYWVRLHMREGYKIFVVDSEGSRSHNLYSGYVEALTKQGFSFFSVPESQGVYEVRHW